MRLPQGDSETFTGRHHIPDRYNIPTAYSRTSIHSVTQVVLDCLLSINFDFTPMQAIRSQSPRSSTWIRTVSASQTHITHVSGQTHPSGSNTKAMFLIRPSVNFFFHCTPRSSNLAHAALISSTDTQMWPNPCGSLLPSWYTFPSCFSVP